MSAITSKARKKVYCDVCKTFISSEGLLPMHNNGKKHQRLLKASIERQASAEKSIYVRGFPKTNSLESDLSEYFSDYGDVVSVFVDKEKTEYAIVEFDCPSVVKTLLSLTDMALFHDKHLIIKPRSVKPHASKEEQIMSHLTKPKTKSDVNKVSHCLPDDAIGNIKQAKSMEDQVDLLIPATCLTGDDNQLRKLIVQYLQEIFVEVFPDCEIKLFGSSTTGLGLKGADLDLSLLVDPSLLENQVDQFRGDASDNSIGEQLEFILQFLRQFAAGFHNIVSVPSARCPLVKFVHRDSGLQCDLSINNRLAVRNTELIQAYIALDPRIRPLAVTLKTWGGAKHLTGSGGRQLISNYSLVLMLLHFLQRTTPPVIPVLQSRCKEKSDVAMEEEEVIIDGWDCNFESTTPRMEELNKQSFGDLLRGWFHYFGHTFDYGNQVVIIHHDGSVMKHGIKESMFNIPSKDTFKVSPLTVQDPFELSHNLTQNASVVSLRRFIQSCMDAYTLLSSTDGSNDASTSHEKFSELFIIPWEKSSKNVHFFKMPLPCLEIMSDGSKATQLQHACDFINSILVHDLSISCKVDSGERKSMGSSMEHSSEKNRTPCDEVVAVDDIRPAIGKRSRDEDVAPDVEMNVKKVKLSENKEKERFVLLCKALDATWQNRRRQRRMMKQIITNRPTQENDSVSPSTQEAMDCEITNGSIGSTNDKLLDSPEKSNESFSDESAHQNITHQSPDSTQPLLTFKVKLQLADVHSGDMNECLVSLCHVDGPPHHFSNFYAFFKKYVTNKFGKLQENALTK